MHAPTTLTCLALVLATPSSDSPSWTPESGAVLTKEFVIRSELRLDRMVAKIGGTENVNEGVEVAVDSTHTLAFTDTYTSTDQRSATTIRRAFTEVKMALDAAVSSNGEDRGYESTADHGLAGKTVVFTRADDAWTAAFAEDEEGEADWLEGLAAEADLAAFLPDGTIEPGTSWDVEPAALLALLRPAGAPTAWPTEKQDGADDEGTIFCPVMCLREAAGEVEGTVKATWTSTSSEGDLRIAEIALVVEVTMERDVRDDVTALVRTLTDDDSMPEIDSLTMSLEWKAEGRLRWDLAAGLPYALDLAGEAQGRLTLAAEQEGMDMEVDMDVSGPASATLTTSR